MQEIFLLLFLFQVKHFLCDFPLQGKYMLGKMKAVGWELPLTLHALVHAIGTGLITYYTFTPLTHYVDALSLALLLGLLDLVFHFSIDRIKASPNMGGRFKPEQPYFWWALGADQMAHHLTHYAFIYIILSI